MTVPKPTALDALQKGINETRAERDRLKYLLEEVKRVLKSVLDLMEKGLNP